MTPSDFSRWIALCNACASACIGEASGAVTRCKATV